MISGEVENRCGRIRENLFKEETGGGIFFTVLFLPSSIGALARHDIDTTNIEKNILKRNREKLKKKRGGKKKGIIFRIELSTLSLATTFSRYSFQERQRERVSRIKGIARGEKIPLEKVKRVWRLDARSSTVDVDTYLLLRQY